MDNTNCDFKRTMTDVRQWTFSKSIPSSFGPSVRKSNSVMSALEQHMASKYAASRAYTPETVKKVRVATGTTMGYLVQAVGGASARPEDETRLVLIAGHSSRKEAWAPLVGALLTQWQRKYPGETLRVLTADNRGVGDSDAPIGIYSTSTMAQDTLALLDVIGWEAAHVAGASVGGMISQEIVLAAPQRVQSLSLMATSSGSFLPDASAYPSMFATMVSSDPTKVTNAILAFLYPGPFLSSKNGDNGTTRELLFKYHKEMVISTGAPPSCGALGQSAAAMLHRVSDKKLRQIRDQGFRILIVGAKLDRCINVSHALHISKVLASDHTKLVLYEDAGHGCFLQHLDGIARNLVEVVRVPKCHRQEPHKTL
jgi:pimeloyl-ACP methyl ester carboxylesterase